MPDNSNYDANDELNMLVESIKDDQIRSFVIQYGDAMDWKNFEKPASRHHHPADEREPYGNLVHTVRVARACKVLADGIRMSTHDTDVLIAAAIIHDSCRYGVAASADHTVDQHPSLPRRLCKETNIRCPDNHIFEIIESHMGIFGEQPYYPQIKPKDVIILADLLCANLNQLYGAADA